MPVDLKAVDRMLARLANSELPMDEFELITALRFEAHCLREAIEKIQSQVRIRSSFCIVEVVDEIARAVLHGEEKE